ncbi:hypothetical protein [Streptomyces sp. enrichment culture]|uniref:hypothetical protein n=1 Tax=Streptomyces sp. enrichment culture TaxID=1795815 RepID=UPI003F55227E
MSLTSCNAHPEDVGMDAGLAAVLGGLAGSVATIGAAFATGWAQREGARITARSEHRRQRREPRYAAYRELIAAGSVMRGHIALSGLDEEILLSEFGEEYRNLLLEDARDLKEKAINVALAGPKKVTGVAMNIDRLSWELAVILTSIHELNTSEGQAMRQRVERHAERVASDLVQHLDNFVLSAQAALDDDGSRRR